MAVPILRDPGQLGIGFGFLNWLKQPGVTFGSWASLDPEFPAANLMTPERPFVPARTLDASNVRWPIDLGAVRSIQLVAIINANSTHWRLEHSTIPNDPAPPSVFFSNLGRNPYNGRVNVAHWYDPPVSGRYLGLVGGEAGNVIVDPPWDRLSVGGLFVGLGYPTPRDIGWQYK